HPRDVQLRERASVRDHHRRFADRDLVLRDRLPGREDRRSVATAEHASLTAPPAQPLTGVRVIDFTQIEVGPIATQMLGDFGADVIKIERPGSGDLIRGAIEDPAGGDDPVYLSVNRNKRSLTIDVKSE